MTDPAPFELYAIRYATRPERTRGQNYILADRPDEREAMDFFCWVAIGPAGTFVIDTGMHAEKAAKHGYAIWRSPLDGLRALGVEPDTVERVIITHLHFDHVGNTEAFPRARFDLQAAEMSYVTGPLMEKAWFRRAYEPDEIARFVGYLHAGRLHLHGPDATVAPGLSVHWVGGHCAGQEIVRVWTRRGWVVLASDALHYDEEYTRGLPFPIVYSTAEMILAHDRIRALADSDAHVVSGHEPRIMDRYRAPRPELEGFVVRLDEPPRD